MISNKMKLKVISMDFVRSHFSTNEPVCTKKTSQKARKKCSTGQRFICTKVTAYKIHILGFFHEDKYIIYLLSKKLINHGCFSSSFKDVVLSIYNFGKRQVKCWSQIQKKVMKVMMMRIQCCHIQNS